MVVDLDLYKTNKPFVLQLHLRNKKDGFTIGESIASISTGTFIPCVVIAFWLGDAEGWPEEVLDTIQSLKSFYGYTEFLNTPIGAPK